MLFTALTILASLVCVVAAVASARSADRADLAFPLAIGACVAAALGLPQYFVRVGGYTLTAAIVPLIQLIMFGMGMTLGPADFRRVLGMPYATLVGVGLQFLVMPLVGLGLATTFGFSGAAAAGIVLVGSVPGGVASNVMTYLARGDVALSVTMTACSTLLSPIMTPLAMQWLAGTFVPVNTSALMWSILQMVVTPILVGLVANRYVFGRFPGLGPWLARLSMAAIACVITITVAASRDALLSMAAAIFAVVLLHNGLGYLLGYWGARLARLPERAARTVSIEVGLQNAGMATGLALSVMKSPEAALASVVFAPVMNMTGALLASWWRKRPA